jgi:hypothetical protein
MIGSSAISIAVLAGSLWAGVTEAQSLQWVEPTLLSLPSVRCCGAMAYDPQMHASLLFGGGNGGIYPAVRYNDTWTFSRENRWSQLSPATIPPARQGAGMAYDPTTGTVVMFGGCPGWDTTMNDTWVWDGVNWTQEFPAVSPPARTFQTQGMAYDPLTETVVMFGGGLGDTWIWNGRRKTWTQQFPAASPPPSNPSIAYDPAHGNVVLFGGADSQGVDLNQTWTWNGETWTQQSPLTSPSPRGLPSMAYDSSIGALVLFGGSAGPPSALNDTWIWNGITWAQLQTTHTPVGRWAASMDFDPMIGLVLFGGELAGDPFTDQTWLFVAAP